MKIPFLPIYILTSGQIKDLQKKIKKGLMGVGGLGFVAGLVVGRLTAPDDQESEE